MTVLFRKSTKLSRLVGPIHKELGRPPPATVTAFNRELRKLNDCWPLLTQEQQSMIASLAEGLAKRRKR